MRGELPAKLRERVLQAQLGAEEDAVGLLHAANLLLGEAAALQAHLDAGTTFADFFAGAELNPRVDLVTGKVCGVRVEDVEDPLMQQIRYLDKLVDELARGRPMEKVLRS